MRFKVPVGATPFKIAREIKSKRALGLAGRDVITEDFFFERTYRLILFWVNTLTRNNCITDLHESLIASVLSWNDVIRHQTPSLRPSFKGVAPVGNLNHILTGKTGQSGKNFLGGLSMHQKLFKTAKTLQAI